MENKSYGEILFNFYWENKPNGNWETLDPSVKESFERAGNKLIQYYEDYILEEFLNKHREDDSK